MAKLTTCNDNSVPNRAVQCGDSWKGDDKVNEH